MAKHYGIDCRGRFLTQKVDVVPAFDTSYKGAMMHDTGNNSFIFGGQGGWVTFGYPSKAVYPEVFTDAGSFFITIGSGQIVIDEYVKFSIRGFYYYNTKDFSSEERTFTTLASHEYHLRFSRLGVPGLSVDPETFYMVAKGNATYNPTALDEDDPAFDTTYDDILIARVTTDESNAITVLRLANREHLIQNTRQTLDLGTVAAYGSPGDSVDVPDAAVTLNWARTPMTYIGIERVTSVEGVIDNKERGTVGVINRYQVQWSCQFQNITAGSVSPTAHMNYLCISM